MPRKKVTAAEAPTADVFDQAIAAQQPAELPVAELITDPAPAREQPRQVEAEHRHEQHAEPQQNHAAQHQRRQGYSSGGEYDAVAKARLTEHQNPYLSVIRFDEKPSHEVRQKMHDAGFAWQGKQKEWIRPINLDSRVQDRLHAERTFREVVKMVREEKGAGQGVA